MAGMAASRRRPIIRAKSRRKRQYLVSLAITLARLSRGISRPKTPRPQASRRLHLSNAIAFIDLQEQRRRLGEPLNRAIANAVEGGQWIMGPQVGELEKRLAEFAGVKHVVACANGTDALLIVLRAWGVGPGDAVFVPAFTFAASAEVVALMGASPVFVDVLEDTYNIDPASLDAAIAMVKRDGKLKPRVVMPVDLFGQAADYRKIEPIVRREKLLMLCDAAQGFGGLYHGERCGGKTRPCRDQSRTELRERRQEGQPAAADRLKQGACARPLLQTVLRAGARRRDLQGARQRA